MFTRQRTLDQSDVFRVSRRKVQQQKMGGWKLEVAKMALYMAFPVTLFHIFNQAELFEDWVTSIRRELYPPENKMHREEIRECIRKMREKDDKVLLQLLEEEKKKTLV